MASGDEAVKQDEFERLARRVGVLEEIVRGIASRDRGPARAVEPLRMAPTAIDGRPAPESRPGLSPIHPPRPAPADDPRTASARPVASAGGPRSGDPAVADWETRVGTQWAERVGGLLLLFGVAFFVKYAFDRGWISPAMRIGLGSALGLLLVGLAEAASGRGYRSYAQALAATGIAMMYVSVYAGSAVYGLFGEMPAIAALAGVAAFGAVVALRHDGEPLAVMAAVGAYLAPVLISGAGAGSGPNRLFMSYLLVASAGCISVGLLKSWRGVLCMALAAHSLLFLNEASPAGGSGQPLVLLGFAGLGFLEYLFAGVSVRLRDPRKETEGADGFLLLGSPALFYVAAYGIIQSSGLPPAAWSATIAFALAAAYAALAFSTRSFPDALFGDSCAALAAGFATTGTVLGFPTWATLAWCVEALVLVHSGVRAHDRTIRTSGRVVLGLAVCRWLLVDLENVAPAGSALPFLNRDFLVASCVAAALAAAAWMEGRAADGLASADDTVGTARASAADEDGQRWPVVLMIAAHLCFLFALSRDALSLVERAIGAGAAAGPRESAQQFALSVLWATYAAALVGWGFARRQGAARIGGLALLAVVVAKLLFVDLTGIEAPWRIVSFLAIGALLLSVALTYHRRTV